MGSFSFAFFDNLKSLVIKKKAISSDWQTITNGLVLIPSLYFKKLVIETENLYQNQLEQLILALKQIKQSFFSVIIRCATFEM